MPKKAAKASQGMDLYIGSTKDDGAVDWKRERQETSDTNSVNQATFEASSFVKLKYKVIVDSVSYVNFRNIKNKN